MHLILMRHAESLKNVGSYFSSETDQEPLTEQGRLDCAVVADDVRRFMERKGLWCGKLYSAESSRSIETATIIAEVLKTGVAVEAALRSTRPGSLSGKSEAEAARSNPEFIEQLHLFRAGLFNAYDFRVAENKEPKKEFERRVLGCLGRILGDDSETLKMVIAHRSSLTCILLHIARVYYNYPLDFSGHVQLDLGRMSLAETAHGGRWRIVRVNCGSKELETL